VRNPWALLLGLAVCALLALAPAAARADCSIPSYAADADARLAGWPVCHELDLFFIETPAGRRQVRMIGDQHLPHGWHEPDWPVRRGIERAAETLLEIGSGRVGNLLVLITGLLPETAGEGEADEEEGWDNARTALREDGEECLIAVFPGATGRWDLAYVLAHEFFHCVQAGVAPEQIRAHFRGQPSHWWVEGSANWFAKRAVPENEAPAAHEVGVFDRHSPERSLTALSYEATPFFFWYARERGEAAIVELPRRMPTGGGAAAQRRDAAALLAPEAWLRFVQDYLDGEIRYPDGRRLPSRPREGEGHLWSDSARRSLEAEALLLHRATLVFTCGRWTIATAGERGEWAVRDAEGGDWGELPETLELGPGEEKRFLLGALGPERPGFRLTIDARRDDDPLDCNCGRELSRLQTAPRDRCLVGNWRLVSGGGHDWLDEQLRIIERASGTWDSYESETASAEEGRLLTITADGRYLYSENAVRWNTTAVHRGDLFRRFVEGYSAGAGLWSTPEGHLELCALSEASRAVAVIELPNSDPFRVELPGYMTDHLMGGAYGYDCSESELRLHHPLPGSPAIEWTYRRVR